MSRPRRGDAPRRRRCDAQARAGARITAGAPGAWLGAVLILSPAMIAPSIASPPGAPPATTVMAPPAVPPPAPAAAPPSAPAIPPLPEVAPALARLDALRRDARDLNLPLAARRRAAESLLDGLRDLVNARPGDPRAALWLADAAEECFISVLRLGGDLDTVLFSLPAHEEWRRVGGTVAVMLDLAQRAETSAAKSIAMLSDPTTPLDAERLALLDRLEVVETPRRLPLLVGLSQALAAIVLDAMPEARRERGRAALARLLPLLDELPGEARWHAACASLLASGAATDAEAFARARSAAIDAAGADRDLLRRAELWAALAESLRGDLHAALERVRSISTAAGPEAAGGAGGAPASAAVDRDFPRRLAEFEARLRLDAGAPAREWVAPLVAAVASAPASRRVAWRDAILARLADVAASEPGGFHGEPRLELAAALAAARSDPSSPADAAALDAALGRARAALEGLEPADPWRATALDLVARLEARRSRHEESTDAFLEFAERFRSEPRAAEAIDRAVLVAEALDRVSPPFVDAGGAVAEGPARARLRRSLEIGVSLYPDLPSRPRWRVALLVLDAERLAARDTTTAESRAALDESLASVRSILASTPTGAGDALAPLRARLSLALAVVALGADHPDAALAALEMTPAATAQAAEEAAPGVRGRLLERRMEALALLDRDLAADPVVAAARPGADAALLEHAVSILGRIAPPLQPGEVRPAEARRAAAVHRLSSLLESLIDATSPPPPDRVRLRFLLAQSLRAAGDAEAAAAILEALLAEAPDRADLLLARAECLCATAADDDRAALGRASAIYERLIADREFTADASKRDAAWWLCHLRMIECHRRAGGDAAVASSRVAMLRELDPSLGGARFAPRFEAFAGGPRGSTRSGAAAPGC